MHFCLHQPHHKAPKPGPFESSPATLRMRSQSPTTRNSTGEQLCTTFRRRHRQLSVGWFAWRLGENPRRRSLDPDCARERNSIWAQSLNFGTYALHLKSGWKRLVFRELLQKLSLISSWDFNSQLNSISSVRYLRRISDLRNESPTIPLMVHHELKGPAVPIKRITLRYLRWTVHNLKRQ